MSATNIFVQSIPALPDDFECSKFSAAVAAIASTSNPLSYIVDLKHDWCIGLGTRAMLTTYWEHG